MNCSRGKFISYDSNFTCTRIFSVFTFFRKLLVALTLIYIMATILIRLFFIFNSRICVWESSDCVNWLIVHNKFLSLQVLFHSVWIAQEVQRGCEEVKDDSRSGRPFTSRIEVNVKLVRQMVYCNPWLAVWMIVSQLDRKNDTVWTIITEDLSMYEK